MRIHSSDNIYESLRHHSNQDYSFMNHNHLPLRPASNRIHAGILLIASACFLAPVGKASSRWELSGTLNYVNPLLSGTFSPGQSFTISMNLDDTVPITNGQRIDFYTSMGSFENAVSNGNVTFSSYTADFASTATHGGIQVRNNETNATSGYDQLNMTFSNSPDGAITAPKAEGFDLRSVEFNFTDETAPKDMITGSGTTFPAIDVPFIGSGTFDLSKSTNAPYHFILRFSGGAIEGTNFIRGTINASSFTAGGNGFADWPALATLPENQRGPNARPANDGVDNLVKYALGIAPLASAEARLPSRIVEGNGSAAGFPVVCYIRDTRVSGVSIQVQVANDLGFSTDLGSTVVSTEDLGDGTERVCVRSNASFASQNKQFFRLKVTED